MEFVAVCPHPTGGFEAKEVTFTSDAPRSKVLRDANAARPFDRYMSCIKDDKGKIIWRETGSWTRLGKELLPE